MLVGSVHLASELRLQGLPFTDLCLAQLRVIYRGGVKRVIVGGGTLASELVKLFSR